MTSSAKRSYEFVKMRGPRGKGFAEMAVARVASCGFETPMSENGFNFKRSFDVKNFIFFKKTKFLSLNFVINAECLKRIFSTEFGLVEVIVVVIMASIVFDVRQ